MISHRSYQMFGNKDGTVVHINDVSSGLSCCCVCPHCKSSLIARKGTKNIYHFAHVASDVDCGYGDQTALHLLAKEILLHERYIILPQLNVSAFAFDVNGKKHTASKTISPYRLEIDHVEDECVLDGIVPDIIIRSGDKELLVEIAVTHFVNDRKKNWLEQRDKASIQIDLSRHYQLSGQDSEWDYNKIRGVIVDSVFEKLWISNPKIAALYKMLLAQAQAEADKVELIPTMQPHYSLSMPSKQLEHPQGKIVKKEGYCQLCNEFTFESGWWYFECSTMTCKCNKCLRSGAANIA